MFTRHARLVVTCVSGAPSPLRDRPVTDGAHARVNPRTPRTTRTFLLIAGLATLSMGYLTTQVLDAQLYVPLGSPAASQQPAAGSAAEQETAAAAAEDTDAGEAGGFDESAPSDPGSEPEEPATATSEPPGRAAGDSSAPSESGSAGLGSEPAADPAALAATEELAADEPLPPLPEEGIAPLPTDEGPPPSGGGGPIEFGGRCPRAGPTRTRPRDPKVLPNDRFKTDGPAFTVLLLTSPSERVAYATVKEAQKTQRGGRLLDSGAFPKPAFPNLFPGLYLAVVDRFGFTSGAGEKVARKQAEAKRQEVIRLVKSGRKSRRLRLPGPGRPEDLVSVIDVRPNDRRRFQPVPDPIGDVCDPRLPRLTVFR